MRTLNVCVAGLGNVGSNLLKTIAENKDLVISKSLIDFKILGISAKNKSKRRIIDINKYNWCDNPFDLLKIKNCDVLVELIGFEKDLSYDLIKSALDNKINVVTGNKALIANYGNELFEIAEKNNVLLLYEAAVAGGIPIIKTIKNNLFLNKINKISGILNGTTNYILTKMKDDNLDFEKVLEIAKSKGYTNDMESALDIGGIDSAHKLTILSSICFGSDLNFKNNDITGISNINIQDINYSDKLGYNIKLISEASIVNDEIICITCPKLINKKNPISNVNGVLNAIKIETDQLKSLFLEGEGAGGRATASSVISDLYEIISNKNLFSLGYNVKNLKKFNKFNSLEIVSSYYLRIMTEDIPGVLSRITSYLTESEISVQKILQIPEANSDKKSVPIIITTHKIKKNKLLIAVKNIENLDFVLEKISIIPID